MDVTNTWIIPFTIIPGVGMMVLSTSNRFFHVNNLIRSLSREKDYLKSHGDELKALLKRSRHFHNTLIFLYLSIGCLSVSALLGYLSASWVKGLTSLIWTADLFMLIGVTFVVFAAYQLIRESLISYRMLRKHLPGSLYR